MKVNLVYSGIMTELYYNTSCCLKDYAKVICEEHVTKVLKFSCLVNYDGNKKSLNFIYMSK